MVGVGKQEGLGSTSHSRPLALSPPSFPFSLLSFGFICDRNSNFTI